MKNFILTVSCALITGLVFLSSPAESQAEEILVMSTPVNAVKVKKICVDGYVFVVVVHGGKKDSGRGVDLVQMLGDSGLPVKCDA
jgi:hypothetical protein